MSASKRGKEKLKEKSLGIVDNMKQYKPYCNTELKVKINVK